MAHDSQKVRAKENLKLSQQNLYQRADSKCSQLSLNAGQKYCKMLGEQSIL